MKQARLQGKRLSDIVEATWEHLKKAVKPICYLLRLITSPVDFSHQVRLRQAETEARETQRIETDRVSQIVRQLDGQTFYDAAAEHRFVLSADGQSMQMLAWHESRERTTAGNWQAQWVKALEAGRIQPATEALHARFSERRVAVRVAQPVASLDSGVPRTITAGIASHLDQMRAVLKGRNIGRAMPFA